MALKTYHLAGEAVAACNLTGNTGGESWDNWVCQTFTPLESYTASSIKLKTYRNDGAASGTITVHIRAAADTDGNGFFVPSGADLGSGTFDVATLGTSSPGAWVETTFSSAISFTAGTRYAVVLSGTVSDNDYVYFRTSDSTNYAFGQRGLSTDIGSTWNIISPSENLTDIVFKFYDSSTFVGQILAIAGAEDNGNHLWKVLDEGETFSTLSSHALSGAVECMAYSSNTRRLYVGIGSSVYCYNFDDMSVVTGWGLSGSVSVGGTVNGLDINPGYPTASYEDYLAVAHNVVDSNKRVSLYNAAGTLDWRSAVFSTNTKGEKVSFNLDGDINACTIGGSSGTQVAALLDYTDGTLKTSHGTRAVSGMNGPSIVSSDDTAAYCYWLLEYASSVIYGEVAVDWNKAITGVVCEDIVHLSDANLVIVGNGGNLRAYDEADGELHADGDYHPITNTVSAAIYKMVKNRLDTYYVMTNGNVGVANPALSTRAEHSVSVNALYAVVHAGDYVNLIDGTAAGTSGSSASLGSASWRRILTEYMPTIDGNIKNFVVNDLTATRLVQSAADKKLVSVTDLTPWVAGTTNQVIVTDDSDGTLTLSTPQNIDTDCNFDCDNLTASSSVPEITLLNTDNEDGDGQRESKVRFKGTRTGLQVSTLGILEFSHDGANDNERGQFKLYLNDGADGDSPTQRLKIDYQGIFTLNTTVIDDVNGTRTLRIISNDGSGDAGDQNVIIGYRAGYNLNASGNYQGVGEADGDRNVFIGEYAGYGATGGLDNGGSENIFIGSQAGYNCTTGYENTCVGDEAGKHITSGYGNVAIGNDAIEGDGVTPVTGNYNTAVGTDVLYEPTSGSYNTGYGYQCLYDLTTGSHNVAMGYRAGYNIKTLSNIVAIGNGALYNISDNETGNVALGYQAGYYVNQTAGTEGEDNIYIGENTGKGSGVTNVGAFNVGIGKSALTVIQSGNSNIAIGNSAGIALTTGNDNFLVGNDAGYNLTTGINNIFFGYQAGYNQTTADNDILIGYQAGFNNNGDPTTGQNAIIGYQSFYNDNGQYNVGLGYQTGYNNDASGGDGDYNVYIGHQSGYGAGGANNTGEFNVGIGFRSMYRLTTGYENIAIGASSLDHNTTGRRNVAIGYGAMTSNLSGAYNFGLGTQACGANTSGFRNIGIGFHAVRYNQQGAGNIGIGYYSCGRGVLANQTNLAFNICVGTESGYKLSSGANQNLFLGSYSGHEETTGDENSFLGNYSGYIFTTGSGNVMIGYQVGYTANGIISAATDSNLLAIGNQDPATNLPLIEGYFAAHASGPKLFINGACDIGDGTNEVAISTTGDVTFVGTSGLCFGSCSMYHGAWLQANAVQNTWYNVSDADFIDGQLNAVTHDGSGKLTVAYAGKYLVNVSFDWENNTVNDHVECGFEVSGSGSAATEGIICNETKFANEEHAVSTTAILDLAAGATIELCVRTTDNNTPTITVDCVSMNCLQVGGT